MNNLSDSLRPQATPASLFEGGGGDLNPIKII